MFNYTLGVVNKNKVILPLPQNYMSILDSSHSH